MGTKLKDLLTYYKATTIKAVWYCYKGRYSDQWNRTDLWQECQTYSMEKKKIFKEWSWDNWMPICKSIKLDPKLTSHTKVNSEWTRNLSIGDTHKTFLVENVVNLHNLEFGNTLLEMTPKTWTKKKKYIVTSFKTIFVHQTTLLKKMNRQPTKWEKIFVYRISGEGFIYRIHKKTPKTQQQKRQPN